MKIDNLSPETRKAFLAIIRQFAIDNGAAKEFGLECAEEAILAEIEAGRVKVFIDREKDLLTLEVL
jgi:hypothetical protein